MKISVISYHKNNILRTAFSYFDLKMNAGILEKFPSRFVSHLFFYKTLILTGSFFSKNFYADTFLSKKSLIRPTVYSFRKYEWIEMGGRIIIISLCMYRIFANGIKVICGQMKWKSRDMLQGLVFWMKLVCDELCQK